MPSPSTVRQRLLLALGCLAAASVQAVPIALPNFQFGWEVGDENGENPGTTQSGGVGFIVTLDNDHVLGQNFLFYVDVAPAGNGTTTVTNWITPRAGSGISFAPVTLYEYWGGTFYTSIGKGEVFCSGMCPGEQMWAGLTFQGVVFEIEQLPATSPVPEPGTLPLWLAGAAWLLGMRGRHAWPRP